MREMEGKIYLCHRFLLLNERKRKENLVTFFPNKDNDKKNIVFHPLNKGNEEGKTKIERTFPNEGEWKVSGKREKGKRENFSS